MELGEDVEGVEEDFVLAIAHEGDADGRVTGFLRFVPCYGPEPGYSLDLMRRRTDAANGLTDPWVKLIRGGFNAHMLKSASGYLGVPEKRILDVVQVPTATAHRLQKNDQNVDPGATERLYRMGIVTRMAIDVFEDPELAKEWLRRPNRSLAGEAPQAARRGRSPRRCSMPACPRCVWSTVRPNGRAPLQAIWAGRWMPWSGLGGRRRSRTRRSWSTPRASACMASRRSTWRSMTCRQRPWSPMSCIRR